MKKMNLPPAFQATMHKILGDVAPAFFAAVEKSDAPISLRRNMHKNIGFSLETSESIPWCPQASWLAERPSFTLDPLFHAGAYYVQEASSMLLWTAIKQQLANAQSPLRALDMCAAPGGKSTLLLDALPPDSLLVCNEVIRNRNAVLRENLEKWGSPSVAVLNEKAEQLEGLDQFFDIIVVDAPCSGEGLFRRDPKAVEEWSPAHVSFCASRQKSIVAPLISALRPNGLLVYSTCTYNAKENEDNIKWLQENFPLRVQQIQLDKAWGFEQNDLGIHAFPHRVKGEGFFLSVLKKTNTEQKIGAKKIAKKFQKLSPLCKAECTELKHWIEEPEIFEFFVAPNADVLALPKEHLASFLRLDQAAKQKNFGTAIGTFKGKIFVPDHALALAVFLKKEIPRVELALGDALLYLKRENFDLPPDAPTKGWALAAYRGAPLGWMKCLPNRINNYLPKGRRILMDIS